MTMRQSDYSPGSRRMKRPTKQTALDMPIEIAITGDLTQREPELTEKLLSLPVGGAATLYINSPGGVPIVRWPSRRRSCYANCVVWRLLLANAAPPHCGLLLLVSNAM